MQIEFVTLIVTTPQAYSFNSKVCKINKKSLVFAFHIWYGRSYVNFGGNHSLWFVQATEKYEKLFSLPILTIICNSKLFFFLNVPLDFFFLYLPSCPRFINSPKALQSIVVWAKVVKFSTTYLFFFMSFFEKKIKLKNEIKKEKEGKIQKFLVNEGKVQKISYGSSRPP